MMEYLNVNFFAVVLAAVATFGLGALWYSPFLFGKQWVAFNGYSADQIEAMRKRGGKAYAVSFACYLVMALMFAVLLRITHISAIPAGIKLGGLLWLGFVATVGLTANLYSDKPLKAYLLDSGYQLVYLVVMGLILTAWR
ncbi:MAG TPA: DUF1761 domain-containing protein [Gammaproteobacteria bacterium]